MIFFPLPFRLLWLWCRCNENEFQRLYLLFLLSLLTVLFHPVSPRACVGCERPFTSSSSDMEPFSNPEHGSVWGLGCLSTRENPHGKINTSLSDRWKGLRNDVLNSHQIKDREIQIPQVLTELSLRAAVCITDVVQWERRGGIECRTQLLTL